MFVGTLEFGKSVVEKVCRCSFKGPEATQRHAFRVRSQDTDLDAWPLELGLERLRSNSRIKAKQLRFRRFPDVTLVLSYCHLAWFVRSRCFVFLSSDVLAPQRFPCFFLGGTWAMFWS